MRGCRIRGFVNRLESADLSPANEGISCGDPEFVFMVNDDLRRSRGLDRCGSGVRWLLTRRLDLSARFCLSVTLGACRRRSPSMRSKISQVTLSTESSSREIWSATAELCCPRGGLIPNGPFAVDSEFCFRRLQCGPTLRHVPTWSFWHHDWRTRCRPGAPLRRLLQGNGMMYAKDSHLVLIAERCACSRSTFHVPVQSVRDWLDAGCASMGGRWAWSGARLLPGSVRGRWYSVVSDRRRARYDRPHSSTG